MLSAHLLIRARRGALVPGGLQGNDRKEWVKRSRGGALRGRGETQARLSEEREGVTKYNITCVRSERRKW
ncbi:hypothetical protein E2C01_076466 [Portunus trituberculatus]|uniref:Uncharacterized protein n=1 Tax=Portunus trituberculatus TaxID=210409 RepID=A0A5B7IBM5_PORTR|nr:hypothetical protein [Portunus trituberculatus]